jgi:hypothetical protein
MRLVYPQTATGALDRNARLWQMRKCVDNTPPYARFETSV